ncbi:putative tail protein [Rhizobium phage RHph_N28_2]|nr:putative tail protein [Rhizobium phage RHph_N28_2]
MPQLYPVAGAKIYLGPAVTVVPDDADVDATDFASVSFTEIKGWQTMGAIGDAATLITEDVISQGRTLKAKGTRNAGSMQNNFIILPNDPGQIALIAAESTDFNYPFKLAFDDAPPAKTSVITVTVATPGVFTWTAHGLSDGTPIKFSTTGALPTGITAGTTYYVVGSTANTFSVAATPGGSAIATTGTQSGVHTATTVPTGTVKYFYGIVMTAQENGGGANTARLLQGNVEINSPVITVAPIGGA